MIVGCVTAALWPVNCLLMAVQLSGLYGGCVTAEM